MTFSLVVQSHAWAQSSQDNVVLPSVDVQADPVSDTENGPVRGYVATQATTGTKTGTPLLETPQSISVITHDQINALQPASISQALRYTTGVSSEKYGAFGSQLDLSKIRGVDADYYMDGLRVISNVSTWTTQIDPYMVERVEILRGPSAALYGQGTGGGIINQISKRPLDYAAHEVSVQLGSFGRKQISFDTTGPLNDSGTLLYRLTGVGLAAQGQVEDVRHKRVFIAPSLTWRPDQNTQWTISATHTNEPEVPDYNSLPAIVLGLDNSTFPQVDRRKNYTDMNFQNSYRKQDTVSSLFEHKFNDNWTFVNNIRYTYINSHIERTSIYNYQDINGTIWLAGTYGIAPASSNTLSIDSHLSGKIQTGALAHTVLAGVDYATGSLHSSSYRMDPVLFNPYDPNNYRPVATPDFTNSYNNTPYNVNQDFDRVGIYLQDQIAYQKWRATLSARHDWSKTDDATRSYSPTWVYTKQNDKKWSGRLGLSYLISNALAPYVSYATSFDPVLGSDYNGKSFLPVEAKQYEVGIKYQTPDLKTQFAAALYQLNQTNVKTSDTNHLGYWVQSGEIRSRGLELQASSEIVRNFNVTANYSYVNNVIVDDAQYQGKTQAQTPKHTASVWGDYQFRSNALAGLQIGAGIRYLGSTAGNPTNTFKVPAVTLADMTMQYDLQHINPSLKGVHFALNINNLTNKEYVASCTSQMYCFIGQDRTATATLTYRW